MSVDEKKGKKKPVLVIGPVGKKVEEKTYIKPPIVALNFSGISEEQKFQKWYRAYYPYLCDLYEIALGFGQKEDVLFFTEIEFETFARFVYQHSSKYISPYL